MKKTFLITVFTAVLAFSPVAYAQQETTSGSDIQSQENNSYYQDNAGNQQDPAELYETGGNDVLSNEQVDNLTVTGDSTAVDENQPKSTLGWLFIASLFFVSLMMPALLYARNISKKEKALEEKPISKDKLKEVKETKSAEVKTTDSKKSEEAKEPVKPEPKKKPAKKKSANKAKKAKKKKK